MIKLSQSPVYKLKHFFGRIDYDILRFDISVHDSFGMAKIEGFEQLVQVKSNLLISHIRDH